MVDGFPDSWFPFDDILPVGDGIGMIQDHPFSHSKNGGHINIVQTNSLLKWQWQYCPQVGQ